MKIKKTILLLLVVSVIRMSGLRCFSITDMNVRATGIEGQKTSFDDMVVRHAKRLCNAGFHNVFSRDDRDFVEFWYTAKEVKLNAEKAYTCLRLFSNTVKSCEVIDYTVGERLFKLVPDLFERYFEKKNNSVGALSVVKENIEDLLLTRFTDQLDSFQSKPDVFITKLSTDLTGLVRTRLTTINKEDEDKEFMEKLRNMMIRFIDSIINKTIWYEDSYQSIWPSVISVADSLHAMGTRGILDDQDNLDELWDSLVRRFTWFLDFKGSLLPVEFYEQIEEDLENNVVFFLEVDEQDEGIKTKKERLVEAIVAAKAKAIAFEQKGVFSDQIA